MRAALGWMGTALLLAGAALLPACGGAAAGPRWPEPISPQRPAAPGPPADYGKTAPDCYLSPTGSDENPGSKDAPWKTVEHACQQMKPGDWLFMLPGTYPPQKISEPSASGVVVSGTQAAPMFLTATPGTVTIDAGLLPRGTSYPYYALVLGGTGDSSHPAASVHWWYISGLHLNGGYYTFSFGGGAGNTGTYYSGNITLDHCEITGAQGVGVAATSNQTDLKLLNCYIHDNLGRGVSLGSKASGQGPDRVLIEDCRSINNPGAYPTTSLGPWSWTEEAPPNSDGFGSEAGTRNLTVINCIADGNSDSGFDLKSQGTLLEGCIAGPGNWSRGFKLWGNWTWMVNCLTYGKADSCPKLEGVELASGANHMGLVGCTIINHPFGELRPNSQFATLYMRDDIIAGTSATHARINFYSEYSGAGPIDCDYCLFWAPADVVMWRDQSSKDVIYTLKQLEDKDLLGEHSIYVDPQLGPEGKPPAAAGGAQGSPVLGHGEPLSYLTKDLAGHARPSPPAIGAYDVGSAQ